MDMDEYQKAAMRTAVYPQEWKLIYTALGLAEEAGEVAGKIKKALRAGVPLDDPELHKVLVKEVGDVQWYVAAFADDLGERLSDIAWENRAKLADRAERGVLKGEGDNR